MEANAQLIVAAPDLYVAAKGCLDSPMGPPGCYLVGPERMQALARAVAKAGKSRPGPIELLSQVHDEANLVHALEVLLGVVENNQTHKGEFRLPAEILFTVQKTFNKWKERVK
jgi:hypothetical protein